MGDRANIVLKQNGPEESGKEIYLYTHWSGYELPQLVHAALVKGRERWGDESYLGRILFQGLINNDAGLTGFGISTYECDNDGYPRLVVDSETQTITLRGGSGRGTGMSLTFEEYAAIDFANAEGADDGPWGVLAHISTTRPATKPE